MARCFSTRASVATELSTHPCISRQLWVDTRVTDALHQASIYTEKIDGLVQDYSNSSVLAMDLLY